MTLDTSTIPLIAKQGCRMNAQAKLGQAQFYLK